MFYLIQVTIYTGLMLLVYLLLLRDRPMHRFNRAYLLLSTVLPLVLPLITLPQPLRPQQVEGAFFTGVLPEIVINAKTAVEQPFLPFWLLAILVIYLLVVMVLMTVRLIAYIRMQRIIGRSLQEKGTGYTILKNTGHGPGSWGRYIFLPGGDADDAIIRHEQVHIELRHSTDIIFMNLMQVLLWPNLFIHLLKQELVQVHEFQADEAVNMDAGSYSQLLLSSVFQSKQLSLAHSFINHPIKRRIMMLSKNRTTGKLRGIAASFMAVMLLAGIITIQSCERKKEAVEPLKTNEYSKLTKMPDYKDSDGLYSFMAENVEYPKEAKEKKIEGKVIVEFVIDENGKAINPKVVNKADPMLAQAALDAMTKMPDWQPGEIDGKPVPVSFYLPFTFKLKDEPDQSTFETLAPSDKNYNEKVKRFQKKKEEMSSAGSRTSMNTRASREDEAEIKLYVTEKLKGHDREAITPTRERK